ncbi:MAG: hypothetical protein ACI8UR_002425 [Natronomonas sp.]|jgi:hypothetical protein|uniref:hypothetical protein n=1 Tax=Natronomonas sp. TaxID=2184060 RepID=UPI0039898421
MDTPTVDSWDEAITLARSLGNEADVWVPKAEEPLLPAELHLQRSNFPWSIHKGAVNVYRERERGDHLQIREYPRAWIVSLDHHNPHRRPVQHATVDIPAHMLIAMGALTPVRGYRWVFGDRIPSPVSVTAFSLSAIGAVPRLGRALLE